MTTMKNAILPLFLALFCFSCGAAPDDTGTPQAFTQQPPDLSAFGQLGTVAQASTFCPAGPANRLCFEMLGKNSQGVPERAPLAPAGKYWLLHNYDSIVLDPLHGISLNWDPATDCGGDYIGTDNLLGEVHAYKCPRNVALDKGDSAVPINTINTVENQGRGSSYSYLYGAAVVNNFFNDFHFGKTGTKLVLKTAAFQNVHDRPCDRSAPPCNFRFNSHTHANGQIFCDCAIYPSWATSYAQVIVLTDIWQPTSINCIFPEDIDYR